MRTWYGYICLAFVLAITGNMHAQDSLVNALSVSIGLNSIVDKDEFQSPYTYSGTNFLFNTVYTRFTMQGMHIVDFSWSSGQLASTVSPQAENALLFFKYDYLFKFKAKSVKKKFVPSLGFGIHTFMSSTNYLPDLESSNRYVSGGVYLTLSGNLLYHLNQKFDLKMQFGLPLAGMVFRPDFEINGETLTKATVIGKSSLFSTKLELAYKLKAGLHLIATYDLSYFSFDEPRPIAILQNGFLIGIRKTF